VIQQVGNALIQMLFVKFMFNDIPHSVGVTRSHLLSKPKFITHSSQHWKAILEDGAIEPVGEPTPGTVGGNYVPLSIDGMWTIYSGNGHLFKFDVQDILRLPVKPVLYLGTGGGIYQKSCAEYEIMDITAMWAAEIRVMSSIPVTESNLVTELPTTALQAQIKPITQYLRSTGKAAMIEGKKPPFVPPKNVARVVHGYNRMVCNMFGMSYDDILERFIAGNNLPASWVVWWNDSASR